MQILPRQQRWPSKRLHPYLAKIGQPSITSLRPRCKAALGGRNWLLANPSAPRTAILLLLASPVQLPVRRPAVTRTSRKAFRSRSGRLPAHRPTERRFILCTKTVSGTSSERTRPHPGSPTRCCNRHHGDTCWVETLVWLKPPTAGQPSNRLGRLPSFTLRTRICSAHVASRRRASAHSWSCVRTLVSRFLHR